MDEKRNTEIPQNTFAHVAFSWNSASARLYLNGVLKDSKTLIPTNIPNGVNPQLAIGNWIVPNIGLDFFGIIDEVEVFDRTLSLSEIQAIFNAGTAGKCKNGAGGIFVDLETQFGLEEGVQVGPAQQLCAPALKNGQGNLDRSTN